MNKKLPQIIFFGTEQHSLIALKTLVEAGFSVAAVITKPDSPKGRGQRLVAPPVKTYALEQNITVWQPAKMAEIIEPIKQLQPAIGVLVSFGKIIPPSVLELFTPGIINLHPSLLPLYRGPSPIESAILNLDSQTGVSIMKLEPAMDAGPVYQQLTVKLNKTETKDQLYQQLFELGSLELSRILPEIISGELQPTAQDDSKASYCQLLSKQDSLIDPGKLTAEQAEAHIRAYVGFPRSQMETDFGKLTITQAHTATEATQPLAVRCQDGNFLIIDQLISPNSGKNISATDFLNSQNS